MIEVCMEPGWQLAPARELGREHDLLEACAPAGFFLGPQPCLLLCSCLGFRLQDWNHNFARNSSCCKFHLYGRAMQSPAILAWQVPIQLVSD